MMLTTTCCSSVATTFCRNLLSRDGDLCLCVQRVVNEDQLQQLTNNGKLDPRVRQQLGDANTRKWVPQRFTELHNSTTMLFVNTNAQIRLMLEVRHKIEDGISTQSLPGGCGRRERWWSNDESIVASMQDMVDQSVKCNMSMRPPAFYPANDEH